MMLGALRTGLDRLFGRGSAAVTVPPLDGALKPNNLIETAPYAIDMPEPDNLCGVNGVLLFSSGDVVYRFDPASSALPQRFLGVDGAVTAIAVAPSGRLAVATERGGIVLFDDGAAKSSLDNAGSKFTCVTAMAFANETTLFVCIGSAKNIIADWQRDLLLGGASGAVWRIDIESGKVTRLLAGLAFPNGILIEADGTIVISESWAKRVIRIDMGGRLLVMLLDDLPGYPSRIMSNGRGGFWLSVFAPRSQLIEFVLREPQYLRVMMQEVEPEFWVAPALRSGVSFREPMQGGALKQMGILKPWAPTRSYGLVIELNSCFEPVRSMHSRAGGRRHGITSAVETDDTLWLTSKGGDQVIAIELNANGA